jgi:hypothetical protein
MRYQAVIFVRKKCPECDGQEAGLFNRIDCGCVWEQIVGEYDDMNTARLVAARKAKLPGRRNYGGVPTGDWNVIDTEKDEEVVACN